MVIKTYHSFIEIDIGKFNFVVAVYGNKETKESKNNHEGIAKFFEHYNHILEESLCDWKLQVYTDEIEVINEPL